MRLQSSIILMSAAFFDILVRRITEKEEQPVSVLLTGAKAIIVVNVASN